MAKKKGPKNVSMTESEKITKPIRLDLTETDHARLLRAARRRGLSMSSFVRMKLLEWLEEEEGEKGR